VRILVTATQTASSIEITMGTSRAPSPQVELCTTQSGSSCSQRYKHAGKAYPCAACGLCNDEYDESFVACMGAEGACEALEKCCPNAAPPLNQQYASTLATYRASRAGDVSCKRYLATLTSGVCPP